MSLRPRYSLKAFLAAARSALAVPAAQRPGPLTLVVGNESADLDSLCSAVLLAYFRSHTPPNVLHVPLSNLARADLRLRPELKAALAGAADDDGVSVQDLITLTDLPDDLTAANSRWLLVDHNALTGDLARRFAPSVVGCIDHHVDEGVLPKEEATISPRVIQPCGSCSSLVLQASADVWRDLAAQQPQPATDQALARLAMAPILIDTSDLKSPTKTTDVDRWAAGVTEPFLAGGSAAAAGGVTTASANSYDRTRFYDEVSRLKSDISSLSYNEILRKDYKQWHEPTTDGGELVLGIAAVVQSLEYMLEHTGDEAALLQNLRSLATERKLDMAAIMTVQHDDEVGFARQLLLWGLTDKGVAAAQAFEAVDTERLRLETWDNGRLDDTTTAGQWRRCWWQRRLECSRKQVAPNLREAMRSV